MRNEIRALMIEKGLPILAYDPEKRDTEGGILGVVKAYYGCVEAQGRGSLHCHMMVWVAGGLNADELKAKALENGGNIEFQKRFIAFMDDTISTEVPPDPAPELETPLSKFHPCSTRGPGPDIAPANYSDAEAKDLHNLVERCQRYRHTNTCWKYWKGPPEPRDCRFDLDKSNETPISVFDPETGEFHPRCLDGLVNNFNSTMIQAIRCNMDIKFIGSGPAAKAVLHYITDYITKSQLQAHVAYAALELAVSKLGEYSPDEELLTSRARRLLQKCAHSMISKQEMSSQQVVSYLMDFEDHFTAHKYKNLYWTSLESFIDKEQPSPECYPAKLAERLNVSPDTELPNCLVDDDALLDPSSEDPPVDFSHPSAEELEEQDGERNTDEFDNLSLEVDATGQIQRTANQACDYQSRGSLLSDTCFRSEE
ncbi:hypothetical protein B0H17DRAFT_1162977 [Mycena rosella]|uniref:Helitron helicase-like domain-containing protein n=1 Tax=Mycena rosella TaxID=1033263 RepID=A0AAD7G6Y9_MYCRO|nr:hypothetical protein B0H17DRAFT_1162977 [Mycena rosella]